LASEMSVLEYDRSVQKGAGPYVFGDCRAASAESHSVVKSIDVSVGVLPAGGLLVSKSLVSI
jgi:hypothetical protein